jgi:hypothetical protein
MKDTKKWEITVQDKHGEQQTFHKSLKGTEPPSSETAAALIQDELVGGRLLPFVSRNCDKPTVYRFKKSGFNITSISDI